MKRLFLLLSAILLISACSKETTSSNEKVKDKGNEQQEKSTSETQNQNSAPMEKGTHVMKDVQSFDKWMNVHANEFIKNVNEVKGFFYGNEKDLNKLKVSMTNIGLLIDEANNIEPPQARKEMYLRYSLTLKDWKDFIDKQPNLGQQVSNEEATNWVNSYYKAKDSLGDFYKYLDEWTSKAKENLKIIEDYHKQNKQGNQ